MTQPALAPTPPMTLPQLEDELLGLAGHLAAAQSRFLTLLAEFDDRAGWAGPGLRSCAHWLTWRIGMSLRTAHEHVRVAHALRRLPLIAEAFAQGRISYSKVRAITRVAVPAPAAPAADPAAAGSAAAGPPASRFPASPFPAPTGAPTEDSAVGDRSGAAAADVGATAGAAAAGAGTAGSAVGGRSGSEDRSASDSKSASDDGSGSAADGRSGSGSAADGRSGSDGRSAPPASVGSDFPDARTPAPVDDIDPGAVPGPSAPAADVERTLLKLALAGTASHVETVVRATRRMHADPARLSARRSLAWRWAEDGSLVVTARLTPADGAALIAAIDSATDPAPAPVRHPVAATPTAWRERAEAEYPGSATDRLAARRADALLAIVSVAADPGADAAPGAEPEAAQRAAVRRGRVDVVVHIDTTDGTASIVGGPEIAPATAERLACDARAQVLLKDGRNRLYLGRRRRLASPAQIAALTVRDAGRCRFAGCTQERHLHAHHVVHWLRSGRTDVDNLVLLCGFHHTLVHERGYGIRRSATGWESVRPDGTPVPAVGEPLVGNVERLIEMQARADLRIEPGGLTPSWGGERLDRHAILAHLLPPAGGDPLDDGRGEVAA